MEKMQKTQGISLINRHHQLPHLSPAAMARVGDSVKVKQDILVQELQSHVVFHRDLNVY